MDFDLRVRALSRLAESRTATAEAALRDELKQVGAALASSSNYEELEQSLGLLEVIAYRASADATATVLEFVDDVEARQLTYGEDRALWMERIAKYQNAGTLIVRALDVLLTLRYLETKPILHAALKLTVHQQDAVRKKALSALKAMGRYDLRVFYGTEAQPGIGANPQKLLVGELERLDDAQLSQYLRGIEAVAEALLSPTMDGTRWTYNSVTISTAATPALQEVEDLRGRTIRLLQRVYLVVKSVPEKLSVVTVLNSGTRAPHVGQADQAMRDMIAANAREVLKFYQNLASSAPLQVVQKVEHNAYWIFFHTLNSEVEQAALAVRDSADNNAEYQIYKVLVGFEGIFEKWEKPKQAAEDFQATDKMREAKASEYAASINEKNYEEWRTRILEYAKTESDDLATFPVFYRFLEKFALLNPKLARKLLLENAERLQEFLIAIMRGLWAAPDQASLRATLKDWVSSGRYLHQVIRLFLDNERLDREILRDALDRAVANGDKWAAASVISVVASNYSRDKDFLRERLFLPALKFLTNVKEPHWINDFWFRKGIRDLIADLSDSGTDQILDNLLLLDEINFHAEEVLYLIANKAPEKILSFFLRRLDKESTLDTDFDAVPFSFHKLHEPLSKTPASALRAVVEHYDGNYGMLIYRGAQLIKNIFPAFSAEFEAELLKHIEDGGERNLQVVLAVLRNYQGEPFTHKVAKAVIRAVPTNKDYLTEVEVALQTTGVVSGEYGMADAYAAKQEEIKGWLADPDPVVQGFARTYLAHLEQMISEERKRATEEVALRKHRYGE